jgi:hypothetical protein
MKRGSVVAEIPFGITISPETMAVPQSCPPLSLFGKACKRHRLPAKARFHLFLTSLIATSLIDDTGTDLLTKTHAPYLAYMNFYRIPIIDKRALQAEDLESFKKIEAGKSKTVHVLYQMLSQWPRMEQKPPFEFVDRVYHMVITKSLDVPLHCQPSAPQDIETLLSDEPDIETAPALVPIVDLCNKSTNLANLDIFTCDTGLLNDEQRRQAIVDGDMFLTRKIVLCAKEDISEGSVLRIRSLPDKDHASLFWLGYIP